MWRIALPRVLKTNEIMVLNKTGGVVMNDDFLECIISVQCTVYIAHCRNNALQTMLWMINIQRGRFILWPIYRSRSVQLLLQNPFLIWLGSDTWWRISDGMIIVLFVGRTINGPSNHTSRVVCVCMLTSKVNRSFISYDYGTFKYI